MTKPNYTKFDDALLANIAAGRNTMAQLDTRESGLRALAAPLVDSATSTMRVIDRRLQAARKRGAVRYNGRAWEVVQRL